MSDLYDPLIDFTQDDPTTLQGTMYTGALLAFARTLGFVATAGFLLAACSTSATPKAKGRDESARTVKVADVRQEQIGRSIDVVGTLTAQDEVTIASQADGAVSRVLVDLGDRVTAGQPLIEIDREKLEYNLENQKATLARALARYGATEPAHLPPIEKTPDVQKAEAELGQAKQAYDRAEELNRRQLLPRQSLDDADATLRAKQAAYDSALQDARNLRRRYRRRQRHAQAGRPPVARRDDPRAVRRLRAETARLAWRVREEPDAGHEHRPHGYAESHR